MEGFFSFCFSAHWRQYVYTVSYLLSAVFLKEKALSQSSWDGTNSGT